MTRRTPPRTPAQECGACGGRGWHTAGGNDPTACGRCDAGRAWAGTLAGASAELRLALRDLAFTVRQVAAGQLLTLAGKVGRWFHRRR